MSREPKTSVEISRYDLQQAALELVRQAIELGSFSDDIEHELVIEGQSYAFRFGPLPAGIRCSACKGTGVQRSKPVTVRVI